MFGRIRMDLGARADSILVPERAIAELQGKTFVWVIGSDNKATQRAVKVGNQIGENFLILEGLKSGDRIVVEGLQKVREGAPVKAMTAEEMKMAEQAAKQTEAAKEGAAKPAKE
jgi:membrane fusion protein (multidrug efflux system)